jgi:hypothetical protein
MQAKIGDIVKLKKTHPCGSNQWEVVRTGADISLLCHGCKQVVKFKRSAFNSRLKGCLDLGEGEKET